MSRELVRLGDGRSAFGVTADLARAVARMADTFGTAATSFGTGPKSLENDGFCGRLNRPDFRD